MIKDTQINIRIESEKIESLKKQAQLKKTTPSSLINEIINEIITGKATNKDNKIKVLESEIEELRSRFEREFDKKIPKTHRVSIGLSDDEYLRLKEASSKNNTSKSRILRQILEGQKQIIKPLK